MLDLVSYLRRLMNADANETFDPATDSLEAIRDFIATALGFGPGISLWMFGRCAVGMAASQTVIITDNLGDQLPDDVFNDEFYITVIHNANAPGTAPEGEWRRIADFAGATQTFTTDAFSANVEEGDLLLIVHESIIAGQPQARGTLDTSSATVPADSTRTEVDDFFNGHLLVPTEGACAGRATRIVDYDGTTGVFTLDPNNPLPAASGLVDYVIIKAQADLVYDDGIVYYNDVSGVAGTAYPVGTAMTPSNVAASARAILIAYGLRKLSIFATIAPFTVPAAMENYIFIGHGQYSAMDTVALAAQDVDSSVFRRLNITGAQGGTAAVVMEDCHLVDPTNILGTLFRCLIQDVTMRDGASDLVECQGWQGAAAISVGVPNPLNLYGWSGDLTLSDMTGGTVNIYARGGTIEILASCTGGTINIYGSAVVADSSGGATVNDYVTDFSRPQEGTQATTNILSVVGTAIEDTTPFKVTGYLSLHNMQAGDEFLVIEEIRDRDDATYREYDRHTYSDVQTSPMVWFEEKFCQGWRVRIQRTAGVDRNVTYQFFTEVHNA